MGTPCYQTRTLTFIHIAYKNYVRNREKLSTIFEKKKKALKVIVLWSKTVLPINMYLWTKIIPNLEGKNISFIILFKQKWDLKLTKMQGKKATQKMKVFQEFQEFQRDSTFTQHVFPEFCLQKVKVQQKWFPFWYRVGHGKLFF